MQDNKNYVYYDEKENNFKVVYEGHVMVVTHETQEEAVENLKSLHQLDGQFLDNQSTTMIN